jgi:type III secretory pathway lipoprotein EscJ
VRFLIVMAIAACAPAIDGPVERQRAADRDDGDRLSTQLATLPGVVSAKATLHHPAHDPLVAAAPVDPAAASVAIVVDDKADRTAIERDTRRLVHAVIPEVAEPTMVVTVGAVRPELVDVGPFRVEAGSRRLLTATLVVALGAIAALAGWIVYTRRGTSAQ